VIVVGIDCGATGAIAILHEDGRLLDALDMPIVEIGGKKRVAAQALALLIATHKPSHAYVESVASRPGQGVSSMFAFGQSVGVVDGVLAALAVPVSYVTSQACSRG
jgi:crossover junction endodeoxyribonuclease RuvC